MRTAQTIRIPTAEREYNQQLEQAMRRAVEHALEDIRADARDAMERTNKAASLSLRRFQFLLMGAASG